MLVTWWTLDTVKETLGWKVIAQVAVLEHPLDMPDSNEGFVSCESKRILDTKQ